MLFESVSLEAFAFWVVIFSALNFFFLSFIFFTLANSFEWLDFTFWALIIDTDVNIFPVSLAFFIPKD